MQFRDKLQIGLVYSLKGGENSRFAKNRYYIL